MQVVRKRDLDEDIHWHCPECRELVAPAERAKHRDLRHAQVPCDQCGALLSADVMTTHVNFDCTHRKMECKWCHMHVLAMEHEEHEVRTLAQALYSAPW